MIDIFSDHYTIKLDKEARDVKSARGSCCTILLAFVILIYSLQKFEKFLILKDFDVLMATHSFYFTDTDTFGTENGFNVAAALADYTNDVRVQAIDETYVSLVWSHSHWGLDENGKNYYRSSE